MTLPGDITRVVPLPVKDPRWVGTSSLRLENDLVYWLRATHVRKVWIDRDKYLVLLNMQRRGAHAVLWMPPRHVLTFGNCEVHLR